MSNINVYIVCIIFGYTLAVPAFEKPENDIHEITTISEDNPGPGLETSREQHSKNQYPQEFIFEIIETKDAAATKDILVIDEIVDAPVFDNYDDMELAETHIFRPLFRYRAQLEKRERLSRTKL